MEYAKIIANIRKLTAEYVRQNELRALVIGVSGGIDSALCVALVEPVCKELKISLIGRSLPIESNKPEEIQRAKAIGNAFVMNFREKDLSNMYRAALDEAADEENYTECDRSPRAVKIAQGNIKARCRMIYLYNLAGRNHGMVLSTDNYTEYMLGFWTIAGDIGDFGMIQNLWKTEVYRMSQFIADELAQNGQYTQADALQSCIDAPATDGLGVSKTSLDQIGAANFEEVDALLQSYIVGSCSDKNSPVIQRHVKSGFKRKLPINLFRCDIVPENREEHSPYFLEYPDPQ